MSDRVSEGIILGLLLILPISALATRRLPPGTVLRYVLVWVTIFAVGVLLVMTVQRLGML